MTHSFPMKGLVSTVHMREELCRSTTFDDILSSSGIRSRAFPTWVKVKGKITNKINALG